MRRLLGIAIVILGLWSCKSGQNYQGVEVLAYDTYRTDDLSRRLDSFPVNVDTLFIDSAVNINWYSLFPDEVLQDLIQQALENNQDLQIAAESIQQAQAALVVQRSQMLPSIGYSAGAQRGNFAGFNLGSTQNVFTGFGSVNWEIDFWGKYRRLNEAAQAAILASEEGHRAVKLSLVNTVATTYFRLLEYKMRLEISEQTLSLRDSMLSIIEQRFDKGIIAEIDLNQAQIQKAIAAGSIPIWERLIVSSENLLSRLIGQLPDQKETGISLLEQPEEIDFPEILPGELLVRRPDILIAEQDVVEANAFLGSAKASRLPNISLSGLLGVTGSQFSSLGSDGASWNIGASILGPLFNWGALQRQVDIEESRTRQAIINYERTVLSAYEEVENLLYSIESLKKELIARREHVEAAVKAQFLSQERYNQGVTSYLEYLESQRQAFDAQLNLAGTKQELLSSYSSLYVALGGGW
ncbi:efflux transporter outer membrane subunit [Algoriphagus kandeliae]|uniref:Efflux transporter outer membrane subunit n=1 Tax=Algoriphagus kandeliae TaxID=2562278 RepID=A0A4Y9QWM4_9BACT|nr:efflux transporter outer membrane subunit [Algoriphagus kandeliae]TFV96042.1 efflux transporter outer membrane subunit [Algoriphagus kandeliae]